MARYLEIARKVFNVGQYVVFIPGTLYYAIMDTFFQATGWGWRTFLWAMLAVWLVNLYLEWRKYQREQLRRKYTPNA